MKIAPLLTAVSALASLCACAVHPDKIPDHTLFGDDEAKITAEGETLRFAVIGNVRGPVPGLDRAGGGISYDGVPEAMIADLRAKVDAKELDYITLMGDTVRGSSDAEWKAFDGRWREVLDGETLPLTEGYRVPVVPVAGDLEYRADKDLAGMEGAFPGVGVDIGFNRVATWYAFDVRVQDTVWRMVVLDSHKKLMGSRWNEQLYWIPRATEGRYDHILVFMHDPLVTLSPPTPRNAEGAPDELLETLEDNAALFKLRGVFAAEPHTTEIHLPDGKQGTAHFIAGGGGAPAEPLERWGNGDDIGKGDLALETMFDLALQKRVDRWAEDQEWPESAIEKAKGSGSWEGFTATYDPHHLPLFGYWLVELGGEGLTATWVAWEPGNTLKPSYAIEYVDGTGWGAKL
ncbi:MAG: hypothetical protein H6739_03460 [Alphaproteobacteria bacterium]|nr:hypothetical protein [Alphaproteobacteria bacterium]